MNTEAAWIIIGISVIAAFIVTIFRMENHEGPWPILDKLLLGYAMSVVFTVVIMAFITLVVG
jgi:ABC-type Fe3+-siderophore transport system permease subunit